MTSDLSPVDRLGEIKARLDAATKGEWEALQGVDPDDGPYRYVRFSSNSDSTVLERDDDALFIAHAPADVGWLLEHIEQLQRQRQGLLDICAAAEAAELKPGVKDSLRIEVPWTRVVRAALGVDRD